MNKMSNEEEEVDIMSNVEIHQEMSNSKLPEILTIDYTVNPAISNCFNCGLIHPSSDQKLGVSEHQMIYSDELDCEDIGANTELLFDENIPAEFEEEVEAEYERFLPTENASSPPSFSNSRSILLPQAEVKFKQTLTVNRSLLKRNQWYPHTQKIVEAPIPTTSQLVYPQKNSKFHERINLKPTNFVLNEHTMKIFKSKIKAIHKRKAQAIAREKKQRPKKEKSSKQMFSASTSVKKVPSKKPEYVNYIPQKSKPIVDPKNSGEIVRVEKAEIDIEVDILSNSEEDINGEALEEASFVDPDGTWNNDSLTSVEETDVELLRKIQELRTIDFATFELLEGFKIPDAEIVLESSNISNLERFIHAEFFIKRPTKTPERYLKIRNHVILMWENCKPTYLSKTTARNGLKKCGDVNCIGRIHSLLEQSGAINFNCQEVTWIRPLKKLLELFQLNIRNKHQSSQPSPLDKKPRIRHSTNIFGAQDSNYTISHDGSSMPSNDSPKHVSKHDSMVNRIKSRTMHKTQFELIKCLQFSKENTAPFEITLSVSCLLCLYFHALSSKMEIMGFLGGTCVGKKLNLTRYKPCRTSNQTAINCEMCPVSQVEQSCKIIDEGFELLGWFHSHPNFPPIPSRTDLKTQTEMQLQFASNNPFIGFILSCVNMEFKCIYMLNETAYELPVEIVQGQTDIRKDFLEVSHVIERVEGCEESQTKFIEFGNNLLQDFFISDSIESIIKDLI